MDDEKKKPLNIEEDGKEENSGSTGLALGLCFGCAFGLLVQVITGDIIWLPIGAAAGYGLGFAVGSTAKKKK